MSDTYLDYSKAIVRWHDRIFQWSEFVSAAVAGRFVKGTPTTDTEIIKDALDDHTYCNELYAAAVAETAGHPATDAVLGDVWAAYRDFLEAAWAYSDSGPRSSTSAERRGFDAAYGRLLKTIEALFPRLPRQGAAPPAEPTELTTPWPAVGVLDWRDVATLILMKNPGMKAAEIADMFNKHPGNLSRYKPFTTVVAHQKAGAAVNIKTGMKTKGKDGSTDIDAIDSSGDPAKMDWDND